MQLFLLAQVFLEQFFFPPARRHEFYMFIRGVICGLAVAGIIIRIGNISVRPVIPAVFSVRSGNAVVRFRLLRGTALIGFSLQFFFTGALFRGFFAFFFILGVGFAETADNAGEPASHFAAHVGNFLARAHDGQREQYHCQHQRCGYQNDQRTRFGHQQLQSVTDKPADNAAALPLAPHLFDYAEEIQSGVLIHTE